ncbi:hypothetical protein D3C87_2141850 [compost metagenome]
MPGIGVETTTPSTGTDRKCASARFASASQFFASKSRSSWAIIRVTSASRAASPSPVRTPALP